MFKKVAATSLIFLFTSLSATKVNAYSSAIQINNYKWSKADSTVSLEIPSSSVPALESGIRSRLDVIAKRIFGKTFYVPNGPNDSQFNSKMDTFYEQRKSAISHINLSSPVLTFNLKTTILTDTADLVSLELSANAMTKGAAHPYLSSGFINFNPKTNLFYDDLSFLPPSQQTKIMAALMSELKTKLGKNLLVDGKQLVPMVNNNFTISGNKLLFTFQPGTVAPAYYGAQTITVSSK